MHRLRRASSAFAFIVLVFLSRPMSVMARAGIIIYSVSFGHSPLSLIKGSNPCGSSYSSPLSSIFFLERGSAGLSCGITITDTGLRMAVFMAARLVLLITGTSILTPRPPPHLFNRRAGEPDVAAEGHQIPCPRVG